MQHLYEDILPILEHAGDIAMGYFNTGINVETKENDTPVTKADIEVSEYLCKALPTLVDGDVYSEEHEITPKSEYLRLIDPIDGTKKFIAGEETWTVLIGLTHKTKGPIFGVIYYPCSGTVLMGSKEGPITYLEHGNVYTFSGEATKEEALYKKNSLVNPEVVEIVNSRKTKGIPTTHSGPHGHLFASLVLHGYKYLAIRRGKGYELAAINGILAGSKRSILADGQPCNDYEHPGSVDKIITVSV